MTDDLELIAETFPRYAQALAKHYPELGAIVHRWGLPAFWCRKPGIDSLVLIILEQQISVAAAQTIHRRLKTALGGLSARRIHAAGRDRLKTLGLTRQKSRYCYELAHAIVERRLSLGKLTKMNNHDAMTTLLALPGIGPWSAAIYLMSALGRIDVWPQGDLALRHGVADILPGVETELLANSGDRWQPHRAVAARLIWHHYRNMQANP